MKEINENNAINGFDYFRTECNQDVNHHAWVYDASVNARRIAGPLHDKVVDDASAVYMAFDIATAAYPEGFWKYDNGRIWHMQEVPAFICLELGKVQISQE